MTDRELEQIYNEAYKAVYWTAMALLKNEADAEDIVQDTFVSLIESYDSIADKTKVVAWLKKTAANKCLNRLTRTKTDNVEDGFFETIEALPEDFLPDSIVESEDTRRIIMNIIDNVLSDDIRRTLVLFYFDDMSTKEIAEVLGIPQGTVLWRLNFAKKRIKKEVEKYEEENNTKLYGMAIPFLSLLFMKEAEQVPFKAMPASLSTTLSASAQASQAGAAPNMAAQAATKGTGTMLNKGLIITIAASAAVTVTAAVVAIAVIVNTVGGKTERKPRTTTRQTIERTRETDDDGWADPDEDYEETTKETEPTQKITEDSIYTVMDGMTPEEIVNNVWKTSRIKIGTTKEEYASRFVFTKKHYKANSAVEHFYWQFVVFGDVKFLVLSCATPYDYETHTVTGINNMSCVETQIVFKDAQFGKEMYEKFLEKYKAEGYEIYQDNKIPESENRSVEFRGHGRSFHVTLMASKTRVTLNLIIPILEE